MEAPFRQDFHYDPDYKMTNMTMAGRETYSISWEMNHIRSLVFLTYIKFQLYKKRQRKYALDIAGLKYKTFCT